MPQCLREGRFGFCHDTEAGIVAPRAPIAGAEYCKRGVPDSFSQNAVEELLRTPPFPAWQPIRWLVHCDDFMVYIGEWEPDDFRRHAPGGDGRALFLEMSDWNSAEHARNQWPAGETFPEGWFIGYYAFRCRHCGKLRGYFD